MIFNSVNLKKNAGLHFLQEQASFFMKLMNVDIYGNLRNIIQRSVLAVVDCVISCTTYFKDVMTFIRLRHI